MILDSTVVASPDMALNCVIRLREVALGVGQMKLYLSLRSRVRHSETKNVAAKTTAIHTGIMNHAVPASHGSSPTNESIGVGK